MTDNEILRELLDGALRSLESVAKMAGELTSGNVAHAAPAIKGAALRRVEYIKKVLYENKF